MGLRTLSALHQTGEDHVPESRHDSDRLLRPGLLCQIFPWHHAAGDFVIRVDGEKTSVKMITVRDYVPMAGIETEPDSEQAILDALVIFFIHLSVRMRLDRLDGVNEVVWAPDACLVP
jgi:hypothetical protein